MIAIVASAIFAALTGSGPATVAAIGTIMFPRMVQKGYPRGDAAGLVSAAAALGPVIPPSTVMIIYATTMSVPISELFVAGVTPGVLIAVLFCVINYYYAKKVWRLPKETKRYTSAPAAAAVHLSRPILRRNLYSHRGGRHWCNVQRGTRHCVQIFDMEKACGRIQEIPGSQCNGRFPYRYV